MILTGRATCQSIVPWIQEDAEQREVRLVPYQPVKHPKQDRRQKKQGGNTHCGAEWQTVGERQKQHHEREEIQRPGACYRMVQQREGWKEQGGGRTTRRDTACRETKAATQAKQVELIGNFTTWLSSAFKFNSLHHSAGEFTCGTISHSQTEHFPLKLEHLPSFVTQRYPDATSQQPSNDVVLHHRPLDLDKKSLMRVMRLLKTERWAHRTLMTSKRGITTLYFTGPWK